jgi:hypothetical protein
LESLDNFTSCSFGEALDIRKKYLPAMRNTLTTCLVYQTAQGHVHSVGDFEIHLCTVRTDDLIWFKIYCFNHTGQIVNIVQWSRPKWGEDA